jgi:ribosomal protein S18 acetylase RimI-like enzyme
VLSEPIAMHRALEAAAECLYARFEGGRFERRSDFVVALLPAIPIAQFNGVWVSKDSDAAAAGLGDAIAEVEASGSQPSVQVRSGFERTRQAALEFGLTHAERIPGMVVRPGELVGARAELDIGLIAEHEVDATTELLAASFEAPIELLGRFMAVVRQMEEARWYVGRFEGAIVSTAVVNTLDGATGIYNVATPREFRGRGYGSALTARAVREGFEAGSVFAFLQSSTIGHGVYRRLGFRDVEDYTLLTRPPQS